MGAPVPAGESGATLLLDLTDARVLAEDVMAAEATWRRHLGVEAIAWEPVDARTLRLHAYLRHPLDRAVGWTEMTPVTHVKDHAPMGVTAIPGRQATYWVRGSQLLTGSGGSGKTMALRSMLHGLVVQGTPVRVTLLDNKRDFADWSTTPGLGGYAADHSDCVDLGVRFVAGMDRRYRTRGSWTGHGYEMTLTPWEPLEVLIVGELLTYLARGSRAEQEAARASIAAVAQTGREAGVVVWAATQTATKDQSTALATVRDLFAGRQIYRVPNASMIVPALGVGVEAGAAAHLIPPTLEGVGYHLDPLTGHPVMHRTAYTARADQAHLMAHIGLAHMVDALPDPDMPSSSEAAADAGRARSTRGRSPA